MSEEVQQPDQPVEPSKPPVVEAGYPIVLSAQEVAAIVGMLRKFPMEQVEGLVGNIVTQFNRINELTPKIAQGKSNV